MKAPLIPRSSIVFLQAIIVLVAIGTAAFLLWEPNVEGVNANATTLADVYLDDPFLAFAYVASIPFFVALFQAFTLLGRAGKNAVFTSRSVTALRTIRYCTMAMVVFIVIGVSWLLSQPSDDRPPILGMGVVATMSCIVVGGAAAVSEKMLQRAIDMKSENDLTV